MEINKFNIKRQDFKIEPNTLLSYSEYAALATESEIVATETVGEYQGEEFFLLSKLHDGREWYGFSSTYYGSCELCDSALGAETMDDHFDIAQEMASSTKWFDSTAEIKQYIAKSRKETHFEEQYYLYEWVLEQINNIDKKNIDNENIQ